MQHILDEKELEDIKDSEFSKGVTTGRSQMINAFKLIRDGESDKLIIGDNIEPEVKEFLEALKEIDFEKA